MHDARDLQRRYDLALETDGAIEVCGLIEKLKMPSVSDDDFYGRSLCSLVEFLVIGFNRGTVSTELTPDGQHRNRQSIRFDGCHGRRIPTQLPVAAR